MDHLYQVEFHELVVVVLSSLPELLLEKHRQM